MSQKSLSQQAHEHAQQQHARALATFHDCAIENGADPRDRAQIALDEARPVVDANRDARELLRLLDQGAPCDAAELLAKMPPAHALSVALALECRRDQRAALRIAFDAGHREGLASQHEHAAECVKVCANIADRLRAADADPMDTLEWIAGELAERGYDTSPPPALTDNWPVGPDGREYPPQEPRP